MAPTAAVLHEGGAILVISGDLFGCPPRGFYWHLVGRGKDETKHPIIQGQPPSKKIILPKMSIALRLRNLPLERVTLFTFHVYNLYLSVEMFIVLPM